MHWKSTPIHIIDFEGSRKSGIVEYGVVTLEKGEILTTQTRLCQPVGAISSEETSLHGISFADTHKAAHFNTEWARFSKLRQTGALAAHHAATENSLLKQVWPYPTQSPDFLNPGKVIAEWGPWIDTCQIFATVAPRLESYKLGFLVDQFGLQPTLDQLAAQHCPSTRRKVHCALYDALAATLLLQYLGAQPDFETMSISWLLTHSATSTEKRQRLKQGDLFEI